MQTLPAALIELVLAGQVDRETAANAAPNRHDFLIALERAEKARAVEERQPRAAEDDETDEALPLLRLIDAHDPAPPGEVAL